MVALGETCLEGMRAIEKRGLRCGHWVKYVFERMGAVEKDVFF